MEDARTQMDVASELEDILSASLTSTVYDDDELLAELADMDELQNQENISEEIEKVKVPPKANPSQNTKISPTTYPKVPKQPGQF